MPSEPSPIGHNRGPEPTLAELVSPEAIDAFIAAELDREPPSVDGGKLKSIRVRDVELQDMCRRFLGAYPEITTADADKIATEVLSTISKFVGGTGRIEMARKALKQPVWDAGVRIDQAFGMFGPQLKVRPLTGPVKDRRAEPYTLAEQIVIRLAAYKDELDRKKRADAQAQADRLAAEGAMAEKLADRGSSTVTMDDAAAASEAAQKAQVTANAPTADLTRTHGGDFGSSSRKRVRIFQIVNPGLVPRHLCVPSDQLIREAIGKADGPIPEIPGILVEDVSDVTRR